MNKLGRIVEACDPSMQEAEGGGNQSTFKANYDYIISSKLARVAHEDLSQKGRGKEGRGLKGSVRQW